MATTVSPAVPTESSPAVPAGGFSQWFRNIGDWLKAMSPNGASDYDTGLVNISIAPGYSLWGHQPQVRRIGRNVHFVGGMMINTGSIPNTAPVTIGTVPPGFTTAYWQHTQSILSIGGNSGASCSGQIAADGSIVIRIPAGVSANAVALKGLSGYFME